MQRKTTFFLLCAGWLALTSSGWTAPQDSAGEANALFTKYVQPTLKQKCQGCHGSAQKLSKLGLATREDMVHGGTRGPAIVPGASAKSLLVAAIEQSGALKMPPGEKLPEQTVAAIRRWIDLGAPWAEGTVDQKPAWKYNSDDVWAFQPVRDYPVPAGAASSPVDAFILRKLREKGIEQAPRADRRTLIRRATFDLWGLPPSPEEVDAFVRDPLPDEQAFGKLVDRLLASSRYGERWGRHWLDVTRYADTGGYSNDFERPNAWRYRDYVIRSFNQDKPYDQFILEQIAGDEIDPNDPEKLVATGFLRMGPWEHTAMSVAAVTRQEWLDDVTHTLSATFLGLTMECARCHDHKFDPLPTKDYYRLQAIFATTEFAERPAPFLPSEKRPDFEAGRARMRELLRRTNVKIEEFDNLIRQRLVEKQGVKSIDEIPRDVVVKAIKKKDLLTGEELERLKVYNKRKELYRRSMKRYDPLAYSVSDGPFEEKERAKWSPPDTFILPVGNLQTPGEKVSPGVISAVYRYGKKGDAEVPQTVAGRRLALAKWIANPENPLTARVMVNRIWQNHFGTGIVATPNNLGKTGKRPTHPELLDWLACYFIEHGWSVKQMHRLIMLSSAYQAASTHPELEKVAKLDPENNLLAYFPPRRMQAEELRDSILAVSGELSLDTGGPGIFPEINEDVATQPQQIMGTLMPAYRPSAAKRDRHRRTIYTFQKRNLADPMIEVFNGPSLNESTAQRDSTTIPTQVFALFNSEFVHDMALAFAVRLSRMSADRNAQIDNAFRLAFDRLPSAEERQMALAHLRDMADYHRKAAPPKKPERKPLVRSITSELTGTEVPIEEDEDPVKFEENIQPSDVSAETRALAELALVLFNSNEFIYLY